MKITKTYKFKLKLTPSQEQRLDQWIGTCRFLCNAAKEAKEESYRITGKGINHNQLCKQLTGVRKQFDWVRDVPVHTCQAALERLDESFQNFFQGRAKYPKWAKKYKYNSIVFKSVKRDTHNRVKLPKIGSVKYFNSQELKGELRRAIVKREKDGYYISIVTKQEIDPIPIPSENQVGVDMGISHFAVTSDGEFIENPQYLKKTLKKLRVEQRSLSRKVKGSNNWHKQLEKVQKLHLKVKRQRKDFLHYRSTKIVKENKAIIVEDLNINEMVKDKQLSRDILDAGWGTFREMLKYKCEWYGREFKKVNPSYTSQECSNCGYIDKNNRKTQSKFKCLSCGHKENADRNAAKVIKGRGTSNLYANVAQ